MAEGGRHFKKPPTSTHKKGIQQIDRQTLCVIFSLDTDRKAINTQLYNMGRTGLFITKCWMSYQNRSIVMTDLEICPIVCL